MSVGKDVSRALKWSAIGRISSQIITWGITLVVIRILEPRDYGLLAIATSFTALFALISELGLGAALVQAERITTEKIRAFQGVVLLAALAIVGIILLFAPAVSLFFEEPQLTLILSVLAGQFLIEAFRSVPHNLLIREMDFKKIALLELMGRTLGGLSVLVLALADAGVWALVLGSLFGSLVQTVGTILSTKYSPIPSFLIGSIIKEIKFGASILVQQVIWWAYSQSDVFIVGKMLSVDTLGTYSIANHLAKLPQQKIGQIMNQVTLSAFSKSQNDPVATLSRLRKSISFLFIVSFPIFFGLASIAQEIVDVILGPQWSAAAVPIGLIPLTMPLRLVSAPLNEVLNALGKPNVVVVNMAIAAVLIPSGLLIGVQWGIQGICWAFIVCSIISLLVYLVRGSPYTGFGVRDCLAVLWRPLAAASLMYGIVYWSRLLMPDYVEGAAELAALVGIGGIVYLGAIFVLAGNECRKLVAFLKP